jgi:two-component system, response regulator
MTNKSVEILLVEDNPNDIELTLYALKKHRVAERVDIVRNGVEALEYLFCTGSYAYRQVGDLPQLILLDLKLPKLDGLEVLRQIKVNDRTQNIPVIALTSSREDADVRESYRLGVNSYIVKPIDFDNFTELIRRLGMYWLFHNQYPEADPRPDADPRSGLG